MSASGRFITLEGIDGAGKSTHVAWIVERVAQMGHKPVATREPGGTPFGEVLRGVLLREPMSHDSEALLMFAARREHLERVIRPALARGHWVVSDRFTDATFAYQGGGHGVSLDAIGALERWIHGDCHPDLTLLFDVPLAVSRERLERARSEGRVLDKFEREASTFFERVRNTYLDRARADPRRFRIVDSTQPTAKVRAEVASHVAALGARDD